MTGEPRERLALPARTRESRLVVVTRAPSAEAYDPVLDVLVDAGVRSIELTLTTPGTLDHLPRLIERYGGTADIGVGTVTTPEEVDRATSAGAHYLVTPITSLALVERSLAAGVPIVPGGLTPTELFSSWSAGAAAVKVFPASQAGPRYLADLRGPFPDIAVVPSGGVDAGSAREWLAAGAAAVSVGGPLLGDAFRGGDTGALRHRAETFVSLCAEAEPR